MYRKLIGCIELFHFELRHAKKFVAASFQNMMCEKPFRKEWFCSWIRNITSGQKMESRPVWTSLFPKYNVQVEFCPEIGHVKGKLWVSHECLSSQPQTSHLWGVSTAVTDVCLSRPFFALVSWSITSSSLLSVSPQEGAVNTTLHRVTYASLLSSLLTTTAASDEIYL